MSETQLEFVDKEEAAKLLKASKPTLNRYRIPWQEKPVAFKIRYKVDALQRPYYFAADITGLLIPLAPKEAPRRGRRRKLHSASSQLPGARQTTVSIT